MGTVATQQLCRIPDCVPPKNVVALYGDLGWYDDLGKKGFGVCVNDMDPLSALPSSTPSSYPTDTDVPTSTDLPTDTDVPTGTDVPSYSPRSPAPSTVVPSFTPNPSPAPSTATPSKTVDPKKTPSPTNTVDPKKTPSPTKAPTDAAATNAPTKAPTDAAATKSPTTADATKAPTAELDPTEAPVDPPTEAPVDPPTDEPVDPTEAPVDPPTPVAEPTGTTAPGRRKRLVKNTDGRQLNTKMTDNQDMVII